MSDKDDVEYWRTHDFITKRQS